VLLQVDNFFASTGVRLVDFVLTPTTAVALLVTTSPTAACPRCSTPSDRIHSRYRRTVADLALHDRSVALRLLVRKFRCTKPDCPQAIFCERLPQLLKPRARATVRLTAAHSAIGFALGGEAGARLASLLAMPTSPDTLLRRIKSAVAEPGTKPRYIGVDDWAVRKGQRYGTIVVDLEQGRVIDLLPGRDGVALEAWLKEHPGVEIVSRDRWSAYAQAATIGAPKAQQVADRWHLLKNIREVVEKLFDRCYSKLKPVLQESSEPFESPAVVKLEGSPDIASLQESALSVKQSRRIENFERVRQLHETGISLRQIARDLGMSVKTVHRYVVGSGCPDWKPGRAGRTRIDAYIEHVDRRIAEGCRNAAEVYRELVGQGCIASASAVLRFFNRRLAEVGQQRARVNAAAPALKAPPSARRLAFEFIRQPEKLKPAEVQRLKRIRGVDGEVSEALQLADEFVTMVRERSGTKLSDWMVRATETTVPEIRGFAGGISQDKAAIQAGLTLSWSNGPVEGHVNRLKVIKRTMYGRAGLELLRARVLNVA
jgi:transposase